MDLHYDLGSDQLLVGRNAPAFRLADGTALADLLPDGKGVILDFAGPLRDVAAPLDDRVRYVNGPAENDWGLDAVLIRPDGIVAWAGGDVPSFTEATNRWYTAGGPIVSAARMRCPATAAVPMTSTASSAAPTTAATRPR